MVNLPKKCNILKPCSFSVVLSLVDFYMLISFVGVIGTSIEGTGVEKAQRAVYRPDRIKQIT